MLYMVPPAGTPIRARDLIQMISYLRVPPPADRDFGKCLLSLAGANDCFFYNSGRTALVHILNALKILSTPEKNEIIIPAYTCFSVPSAILRAGLKIRLADIDHQTMDYNYDKLRRVDFGNVLAVLSCNLFGIISNWDILSQIAVENHIFAVEDAAQTLGVNRYGKASGGFGDVAFFSFGRGKNLSTYSGGAAITSNKQVAAELKKDSQENENTRLLMEFEALIKMSLYALFLHPRLYWFPNALPFLNLGETAFEIDFKMGLFTKIQYNTGAILFQRLDDINSIRATNVRKLSLALLNIKEFCIPGYSEDDVIPYVRLPVIVGNRIKRNKMLIDLRKANIVASSMYPSTVRQIPGIDKYLASTESDFPGADEVVNRLICLPTHPYLSHGDIERIIDVISKA